MKELDTRQLGALRFRVNRAASELGIAEQTMSQRLKVAGIAPGDDGCFSMLEIFKAMHGDLQAEKIGLTREQKEYVAIKRRELDRELAALDQVMRVWSSTILEYRQRVIYSEIPAAVKRDLLAILEPAKFDEYFPARDARPEEAEGNLASSPVPA